MIYVIYVKHMLLIYDDVLRGRVVARVRRMSFLLAVRFFGAGGGGGREAPPSVPGAGSFFFFDVL